MYIFVVSSLVVAGLAAGCGQRVLIVRYGVPRLEPPRCFCRVCYERLLSARGIALVPLGRCHACRQRVGPPPLSVEAVTALLLGALAARLYPSPVLAAACWLALCAVPLAFIDIMVQRLPDLFTVTAYGGTVVLLVLDAVVGGRWEDLGRSVIAGLALTAFYLMFALVSPGSMGLGDVKAAASIGTVLAWTGWPAVLVGTFTGFVLALLYFTVQLALRRASRKQRIPFGPFMFAGAFAVLIAGSCGP